MRNSGGRSSEPLVPLCKPDVGEEELAKGTFVLKDMASGEQTTLSRDELIAKLSGK